METMKNGLIIEKKGNMKHNNKLTFEEVSEILRYDKDSGKLFRLMSKGRWKKGSEAGSLNKSAGYRRIRINGILYYSHRLAYLLHFQRWPSDQIDHINQVRNDNRISNLRVVSNKENSKNKKKRSNNTSGTTGIFWRKDINKWRASIKVNNKNIHLGYFTEKCDAICARKSAEVKYGFHPNHGK